MSFHETIQKIGIQESDIIEWREAKYHGHSGDDYGSGRSVYILLTKKELIFVKKKGFLSGVKILFHLPIEKINHITKLPLTSQFIIYGNVAEKKANFLKKLFKRRSGHFNISEGKSFIQKLKELNPEIK